MVSPFFSLSVLQIEATHFKAGNISNCLPNWETITADKYILEVIAKGVPMDFLEKPNCKFNRHSLNFSNLESEVIKSEIIKLLGKGVIIPVSREPDDFVSGIFTRPKKDGSYRMILNLKKFNEFLKLKHCKLESINDALDLVSEGCYFASVDLKDAYYSVGMDQRFQKYLKFYWNGQYYQYTVLPNGFAPAVREFTKILTPPFKYLRSQGHLSVKYLDDSLLLGETSNICLVNVRATVNLLRDLGFTIHPGKSVLIPTQQITFLGFIIDSVNMNITLTDVRKATILELCSKLLTKRQITIRELAQTIGTLVSSFRAVPYGQLHYRELEKCKILSLRRAVGNFDKNAYISREAAKELKWWKHNVLSVFAPIRLPKISYVIFSDASLEGWGGTDEKTDIGGRWTYSESENHINALELLAAFMCLQSFCKDKKGLHVMLKLDNTTAVAYVNHKGGTHSEACNKMALDIWEWAIEKDIWLSASHVPGIKNTVADLRSRVFYDNKEWSLNSNVFKLLCKHLGKPDIDLFASRLNTQCNKYVSYKPDPNAFQVDAFSINWSNITGYIFCPFSIIGKVLSKIVQDEATVLMVVPCWQTQPWFPQFVRLIKADTKPLLIRAHQELLQLPGTPYMHPLCNKLNLVAARLCGIYQQRDCLRQSQRSLVHHGDPAHKKYTVLQFDDGWSSAAAGSITPSNLL